VVLKQGHRSSEALKQELLDTIRRELGPLAVIGDLHFVSMLPKTRSGKIMRRILRKIGEGALDQLGDTSTLADPSVVDQLVAGRQ
jgi:acetyl-CoA synthetase